MGCSDPALGLLGLGPCLVFFGQMAGRTAKMMKKHSMRVSLLKREFDPSDFEDPTARSLITMS